jgi:DNA-binding transcriptional ArsR family regulator
MTRRRIPKITHTVTAIEKEEHVNEETGEVRRVLEIYEPDVEAVGPHRGRPKKGTTRTRVINSRRGERGKVTKKWAYVDAESMSLLDLTRQEYRVFQFLMGKMEQPSGEIRVTGAYIARSIGMTPANVSKSMKSLRERLIIIPEGLGIWRMNSWIAYMGEYKKWYPAAMDDEEPYWTQEEYDTEHSARVLTVVE